MELSSVVSIRAVVDAISPKLNASRFRTDLSKQTRAIKELESDLTRAFLFAKSNIKHKRLDEWTISRSFSQFFKGAKARIELSVHAINEEIATRVAEEIISHLDPGTWKLESSLKNEQRQPDEEDEDAVKAKVPTNGALPADTQIAPTAGSRLMREEALLRFLVREIVRKCGSEWCLYSKKKDPKTGKRKRLGKHSSIEGAKKQERAIQAAKHGG